MNPYENLPSKAFWKLAIASRSMFDIGDLWDPKFNIEPTQKVATYGSCFAQHIGNALRNRGFNWFITENAPESCSEVLAKKYSYEVFTARTGNIYTTSLLRQWTEWALNKQPIPDEIWEKNGRYYDPFRPRIEPNGFQSEEDVKKSQAQTLSSFRESIVESDYFVFTLGLTESWFYQEKEYEYPMCPGTVVGEFNKHTHKFENQQFSFIRKNLLDAITLMHEVNPKLKFILTVSPVPLTATNTNKHVVVATMGSKSVLRAVAEELSTTRADVDYFPSYEIINSPVFKGAFFEPNQRSVNPYGVNFVMDNFFSCLLSKFGDSSLDKQRVIERKNNSNEEDEACDEAILQQYA